MSVAGVLESDAFPANPFRAALARGRPLIGVWSMLNSVDATEALCWAGYDWILIDGEHAPVSLHDAMTHCRTVAGTPTIPIVRLLWNDPLLLKSHLDAGIGTIMLPYVQTAHEATEAVRAMRYPPRGARGIAAMHRGSRYSRIKDYAKRADETLFLIVQIETKEALDNCEAIAAVDGVDAVFFGPGDLAASMGLTGQATHPDVTAAIEEGLRRCRPSGKAVGVLAPNDAIAERHIRSGFDFVSVANDFVMLVQRADQAAAHFREVVARSDGRG